MRVTQEASRIKTRCKKLFSDLDQSKCCEELATTEGSDLFDFYQSIAGREGTLAWKAFVQLLELNGIKMTAEDQQKLQKLCKAGTMGSDQVEYKKALQFLQPNFDLSDPLNALWSVRQPGQGDRGSLAASSSRASFMSKSPSMVSIRSLNNLHSPLKKAHLGPTDLKRQPI